MGESDGDDDGGGGSGGIRINFDGKTHRKSQCGDGWLPLSGDDDTVVAVAAATAVRQFSVKWFVFSFLFFSFLSLLFGGTLNDIYMRSRSHPIKCWRKKKYFKLNAHEVLRSVYALCWQTSIFRTRSLCFILWHRVAIIYGRMSRTFL